MRVHEQLRLCKETLNKLAAYDDDGANERFAQTNRYSWFDEPNAVQLARETLSMINDEIDVIGTSQPPLSDTEVQELIDSLQKTKHRLIDRGISLEDTKDGVRWRRQL